MGRLLPTRSETSIARSDEPSVVFLDDDRADTVLAAVRSDTARTILRALLREPASASELATAIDSSVENVSYHLETLQERQLIEEYDTVYSEKGREMTVYGVAEDPLVVIFGSSENEEQLLAAFSRLASVVGPVGVLIALKEVLSNPFDLLDLV